MMDASGFLAAEEWPELVDRAGQNAQQIKQSTKTRLFSGNNDMLWCEARQNGWILETSELKPFAGGGTDAELERFAEAILSKPKWTSPPSTPQSHP